MRRASASRPSAPRRTTRGFCSAFSNREHELLEPSLSYRKQTTAPSSNRELTMRRASPSRASAPRRTTRGICSAFSSSEPSTNLCGNNSQLLPPNLPQIYKWSRPLLTGTTPQTEFDVTCRKQTTEKFLTGARTHISETRFCAKISVETNEEMSEEMKANR